MTAKMPDRTATRPGCCAAMPSPCCRRWQACARCGRRSAPTPVRGLLSVLAIRCFRAPRTRTIRRGVAKTRGYTEYWTRSGGIDRGLLAASLPRLADTADEIKHIGERLGASANDIYLGAAASETTVKAAQL